LYLFFSCLLPINLVNKVDYYLLTVGKLKVSETESSCLIGNFVIPNRYALFTDLRYARNQITCDI